MQNPKPFLLTEGKAPSWSTFMCLLGTALFLCLPLSDSLAWSIRTQSHPQEEKFTEPWWCMLRVSLLPAVDMNTVLLDGAFSSVFCFVLFIHELYSFLTSSSCFSLWPSAGFCVCAWQWMAGGLHGASGLLVGPSARTGVGESARRPPPRTEARTAMASSCNPRTALMGFACRVSQFEQTKDRCEARGLTIWISRKY